MENLEKCKEIIKRKNAREGALPFGGIYSLEGLSIVTYTDTGCIVKNNQNEMIRISYTELASDSINCIPNIFVYSRYFACFTKKRELEVYV